MGCQTHALYTQSSTPTLPHISGKANYRVLNVEKVKVDAFLLLSMADNRTGELRTKSARHHTNTETRTRVKKKRATCNESYKQGG